jgi:uncharacterized protein YjbJ (UPF0337 family)
MSIGKKIAHRAEAVKGSAMKTVGRLTGNRRLRAGGRRDQAKGSVKQYGTKIKDALKR